MQGDGLRPTGGPPRRARTGDDEARSEPCPICGRPLIEGPSVNRHHLVPRSEGGRETVTLHRICHRKIHSLWTERELARLFDTPEAIRAHPEMQRFIEWVRRKHPEFYAPTRTARSRSGGRR